MVIETNSAKETFELGRKLGLAAAPGMLISLDGDLGTGKTVFTKGVADGLSITEPVCSPTFTLMQVYDVGRIPMYHFDVYRIDDPEELEETGYREFFFGNGVCLVEWAELIGDMIPDDSIRVKIEKDPEVSFDYRRITVIGEGVEEIFAQGRS